MASAQWHALESNPDTINTFLGKIGVKSVECVDIFSFDQEMLEFLPSPQLAVILCFPERGGTRPLEKEYEALKSSGFSTPDNVFFMKQKIGNACGTFALFHALANLEGVIDLGEELSTAHEETAREGETEEPAHVEHHFICYVKKDGVLYEIDSCAPFPRPLGNPAEDEALVTSAGKHIKKLMEEISDASFSAMALVKTNCSIECRSKENVILMQCVQGWQVDGHLSAQVRVEVSICTGSDIDDFIERI
ncbi:ubiquitin carboxyl-terminal hydrolase, family 1 [Teladorsagia circumcincta]|uniref:Ubiquitin carboxyl-terminal hydrolase n=1 Tax=Teladorsagia circumcincta TaxID=45464 RepID=A0A2G9V4C5_TELCI|nr:ubiquitin carboxyl-terminal hydrolase, family 1 [Teladorsagia circumcincta]